MTEIGYSNKDEAIRKTSSESEGKKQESNNNEEDSKPTVLVKIENTAVQTGSNRLDSGRGGRKIVTGSKRTTSHIVWESDYVITSEWKIETDCKKPKLNGTVNQAVVIPTNGKNCIPKRKGKKSSKALKVMKEAEKAEEELSESKLDNDLENYFIASKKKKADDNKMEVDEPVVEDVTPSSEEKKSESVEIETENMETDEPENEKEQLVENKADDKEQWSDKWSDGKKDEEDPLTEEEEQTLLDEDAEKINDEKTEAEIQDCSKSDVPEEAQEPETLEEPSSEENKSEEPVEEVKSTNDIKNTPDVEKKTEKASEETPAEASADSLPSLEVADASTDQPDDDQSDVIPWQRIVKVSIPEEAIGKTQIRQQDLINKIGKKNYGGKVYYEKGQTEAYLLVTESAKDTVAAMTENPGTKTFSIYVIIYF